MLLTLGAAGATLLVVLALLGGPAIDACHGDDRGLVKCLRGMVDDKFDFGLESRPARQAETPAAEPVMAETPVPVAAPPEIQVAEVPAIKPATEPTRSLAHQVPEKPTAPVLAPQQVVLTPTPGVVVVPDLPAPVPEPEPEPVATPVPEPVAAPELTDAGAVAPEPLDTVPAIAVAAPVEPSSPVEPSPAFVPPSAAIAVAGVPPDLQVTALEPDPAAVVELPADPEPPSFVPPAPVVVPDGLPPDLQVAATEPDPAPPPTPAFVLPVTPDLPVSPPADLVIAAIDPVVLSDAEPAALPVMAPTIDAVEIDGAGNFIAGNGPAGATMRLYVDGIPAGVSPVENGRWLVEGTDLLTEEQQTLKVEALDPLTGRVLGHATIIFEGPTGASVEELVPELDALQGGEPIAEPPAATTEQPELRVEEPVSPAQPEAAVEAPLPIPAIRPVVPAVESPSVVILRPAPDPAITMLPTGNPSDDAVVTLGAAPASPAILAHFALPGLDAGPDVAVLRARPIGDPGAGRFVSGKAIIRRGDTLWDIAHRYYGRGVHYRTILRANRELIARPGTIFPGQVLELPLVYDD